MFDLKTIRNQLAGKRVLYVEDDITVKEQLARLMAKLDIAVDTASDGLEGFEMAKQHRYDLVVTDHLMPGLNGLEMAAEIRWLHPEVPIIVSSAFSDETFLKTCDRLKIERVLQKPFSANVLIKHLAELLLPDHLLHDFVKKKGGGNGAE